MDPKIRQFWLHVDIILRSGGPGIPVAGATNYGAKNIIQNSFQKYNVLDV